MVVYFATDHAGFAHKEVLLAYVRDELGYVVEDCGALHYDENDDYPDFISQAAHKVGENPDTSRGIIFGGSGQGEAMVANRVEDVRATVYYGGSKEIITLSREHNNANILSIGARFVSLEESKEVVKTWLETPFNNDVRHVRRINKFS